MELITASFAALSVLVLEAQLSAVDALIDSMSLVQKDEEEGTIEDLFPNCSKIPNPQFQRLFQVREGKMNQS